MPLQFGKTPGPEASFLGFPHKICICLLHESRRVAIHIFALHGTCDSEPKNGHKESRSHDYYMFEFIAAYHITCTRISSFIGNKQQRSKYLLFSIGFVDVKTKPAKSVWNLGVIFDKNFTFRSHITAVYRSCFYHIRDLQRIRYLDIDSAKLLANALVSSHLNYCNSLLSGIVDTDLTKL